MAGGPCRPRSSSKSIAPNREPLVFGTNFGRIVGIALLQSNGRKGRQPLQWKRHCRPPSLFIQKHCAKSGKLGFCGTNSERANEPPMGGSFCVGNWGGDRSIGGANLRKGLCPFNGSGPAAPFNGWRPVPPSLFIQKHYAKSGTFGFSERTPEVLTNLPWEVRFFCGERGGDRSIGGANLRKGAALQWLAHLAPVRGASPFYGCGPAVWRILRPPTFCRIRSGILTLPRARVSLPLRLCASSSGRLRRIPRSAARRPPF